MKKTILLALSLLVYPNLRAQDPGPRTTLAVEPSSEDPISAPPSPPVDATLVVAPPATTGLPTIEMKVAKAAPVNEREAITRLQVFLDNKMFGPGKIDGAWGEFTAKAYERYQEANGLPVTPDPQKLPWNQIGADLPMDEIGDIYTQYEITPEDLKFVGDLPRSLVAQEKMELLPYTSLLELMGERYHSDPSLLEKLNIRSKPSNWKVGDIVWVPNVEPFKIAEVKQIAKLPKREDFLERLIHIDTSINILELKQGDKLLASVPITPGSSSLPAPKGTWRILGIAEYPWFRHDESVLNHGVRSNNFHNIPPGPNSPVGVIWMGLNKPGIGIHGTNNPNTIGRAGSHGCIRVANWDVIRLSKMVTEGMTVQID